jgi:NADH-quinone oxidoreductase subunit C
MNAKLETVVSAAKGRFNVEASEFRDEVTLIAAPDQIVDLLKTLRDEFAFEQLIDVTAVDYGPASEPRFHIVYHLRSLSQVLFLRVRAPLPGRLPQISTVEKIYPAANWYEREIFDMFGVTFTGHSDMRRILMPADWQGHPLRKDYPLGYEEVQFSFNFNDISLRKPHPKE